MFKTWQQKLLAVNMILPEVFVYRIYQAYFKLGLHLQHPPLHAMPMFIQECSWTSHPGLPAMVTLYNPINKGKWSYNKALFNKAHDDSQLRVSAHLL